MTLPTLPGTSRFSGEAFRNIYTIINREDLLDDILDDEGEKALAASWRDRTSQIDSNQPFQRRAFQYGDNASSTAVFSETSWAGSRFTRGQFGVWYGSLAEQTSVKETLYWFYRRELENLPHVTTAIRAERSMYAARLMGDHAVDLRPLHGSCPDLTSNDYGLCQALGDAAKSANYGLYLAPSARDEGGTNSVVFRPDVIDSDKWVAYYQYFLEQDGTVYYRRIKAEQTSFEVPDSWKLP